TSVQTGHVRVIRPPLATPRSANDTTRWFISQRVATQTLEVAERSTVSTFGFAVLPAERPIPVGEHLDAESSAAVPAETGRLELQGSIAARVGLVPQRRAAAGAVPAVPGLRHVPSRACRGRRASAGRPTAPGRAWSGSCR